MGHDLFRPNSYIPITDKFRPLLCKFCSQNIANCNKDQFIDMFQRFQHRLLLVELYQFYKIILPYTNLRFISWQLSLLREKGFDVKKTHISKYMLSEFNFLGKYNKR